MEAVQKLLKIFLDELSALHLWPFGPARIAYQQNRNSKIVFFRAELDRIIHFFTSYVGLNVYARRHELLTDRQKYSQTLIEFAE